MKSLFNPSTYKKMLVILYLLVTTCYVLAADQYSNDGEFPQPLADQSSFNSAFYPNAFQQPLADQSSFENSFNPSAASIPPLAGQSSFMNAFNPSAVPLPLADQSSPNSAFNPNAFQQPLADQSSFSNAFNPSAVSKPLAGQSSYNSGYSGADQPLLADQLSFNPDFNPKTVPRETSSDSPRIHSNISRNFKKPSHQTSKHKSPQEHHSRSHTSRKFGKSSDQPSKRDSPRDHQTPPKSKKPSDQASKSNNSVKGRTIFSKVVRTFATNFIQKLLASQRYIDAFALHKLSRQRAARVFYDLVYQDNLKAGNRDPAFSAFTVSQAVKYNYRTAESLHVMEVYAYATGELLYQKGYLTAENAKTLSDRYFKTTTELIEAANAHSPQENLTAVRHGFINFLSSTNLYKGSIFVFDSVFVQILYALRE